MLAKVSSGSGGITDYLERGRKKGREFDRDLIDERVPLSGDIEIMDATIDSMETAQQGDAKYLHITLGFSEDFTGAAKCGEHEVNYEKLKAITESYRDMLMAAYDPSEYAFYAEAHIPKVTHEINASSGEAEKRLPHVHIIIPMRNLEDGRYLNPLGFGKANLEFNDAIQEKINIDYRLTSPTTSKRDPNKARHPLAKHNDRFAVHTAAELKKSIRTMIATGAIRSFDDMAKAAEGFGEVKIRRGKEGDYINVKPAWAAKGINLKDLTRETVEASAQAMHIEASPTKNYDAIVEQWRNKGSLEARYITSGNRHAYKALDDAGKAEMLGRKVQHTQERLRAYDKSSVEFGIDVAAEIIGRAQTTPTARPFTKSYHDELLTLIKELHHDRRGRTHKSIGENFAATAGYRSEIQRDHRLNGGAERGGYAGKIERTLSAAGPEQRENSEESRGLTDAERIERSEGMLGRAERAIAYARQALKDPQKIRRYLNRRRFDKAFEAALPRLRPDQKQDEVSPPLTPASTADRLGRSWALLDDAGTAIDAGAKALSTKKIQRFVWYRNLHHSVEIALLRSRAQQKQNTASRTVIQALRDKDEGKGITPARLKADTSTVLVLQEAQKRFGINLDDYTITSGKDGTPRIQHDGKQYNLGDFFTKHIGIEWKQAAAILTDCYHATLSDGLPPPDKALWKSFSGWRTIAVAQDKFKRESERAALRGELVTARNRYKSVKLNTKVMGAVARQAVLTKARAELIVRIEEIKLMRKEQMAAIKQPSRNAQYRAFLNQLACQGNLTALAEMRRIGRPETGELEDIITGRKSKAVLPLPQYTIDANGKVTYYQYRAAVVADSMKGVAVLKASDEAYNMALKVAVARYGTNLTVRGDERFMRNMVAAGRKSGLNLTIHNANKPREAPVQVHGQEKRR